MLECSQICAMLAFEFNKEKDIAMKVGFFHDVGKAQDFEFDHDHVAQGLIIAKKFNLGNEVIDAIKTHHTKKDANSIYSKFAIIADTISASRPGARNFQKEDFNSKKDEIDKIAAGHKEITQVYLLNSGRKVIFVLKKEFKNKNNILYAAIEKEINENEILKKISIKIGFKYI
jgi:ribonuclease Y